jgi:two-component system sensor histidine kinase UhpB
MVISWRAALVGDRFQRSLAEPDGLCAARLPVEEEHVVVSRKLVVNPPGWASAPEDPPSRRNPERRFPGSRMGVQRRIMLYVITGLVLMFGVLILAGLRALDQATQLVFEARLSTAKSLALILERDLTHVASDVRSFEGGIVRAHEGPVLDRVVSEVMGHLAASDSFAFFDSDGIQVLTPEGRLMAAAGFPFDSEIPRSVGNEGGDSQFEILSPIGDSPERPEFAVVATRVKSGADEAFVLVHLSGHNSARPFTPEDFTHTRSGDIDLASSNSDASYHLEVFDSTGKVVLGIGEDERPGVSSPHFAAILQRAPMIEPVVLRHLVEPGSEARDHVMGVVPLSGLGFTLILEQPIDVALALPRHLRQQLLLWSAASFAGALVVAWATTRSVVRPTQQLTLAAERIAGGDLESPIEISTRDEFAVLAERFESMRHEIQQAYDAVEEANQVLETRVRERTARLGTLLSSNISAQEEERARLARELHDGTAQTLGALSIALGRASDTFPLDSGVSFEQLQKAKEIVALLLEETRRLILDLRPMLLDDMGLIAAIRWDTESRLADTGIESRFEVETSRDRFPPHVETAVFRIVQEATNNVVKHSQASHVGLGFSYSADVIHIVVTDDGRGFDMADGGSHDFDAHVGLAGMRERVSLLGGEMSIDTEPGSGTTVRVEIPVIETAG